MSSDRMHLECRPDSPRRARAFVGACVGAHPRVDDLVLLTSELVTNAVEHAASLDAVTVEVTDRTARVEVSDRSTQRPQQREPDHTGGRGLRIVDAVADRWGVECSARGKTVWFEIDHPGRVATRE